MRQLYRALLVASSLCIAPGLARSQSEPITEENIIEGQMAIEFNTRTQPDASGDLREGSPAIGAADKYTFTLRVARTTEFQGEIVRLPNLYTRTLQRQKQAAQLAYKSQI